MIGGVVQWAIGTSRSVRNRNPRASAIATSVVRSATVAPFGEQNARFLEQLPDRRDGERRVVRREVAGQPGVRVRLVDPTPREHEHVAGERHRRRALRQEDLRRGRARP
jgi:hypothetical protein